MRKDVIKREKMEDRVLYEPNEPLFPPVKRRRWTRRAPRALFCLFLLIAATLACIYVGAKVSSRREDETGGAHTSEQNATLPAESLNGDGQLDGNATETETETEGSIEESETVRETESVQDVQSVSEPTRDEVTEPLAVTDISEIELGERYIVNYTSKKIDVAGLIDRGFVHSVPYASQAPVVLVIHTHTSEKYNESAGSENKINSVVAAGDRLVATLNFHGLSTVHCTVIHDEGDDNAYLAARDTILMMLRIYPTVKYVIDVHRMILRDESGGEMKTQTTKDGASQIKLGVYTDVKREGDWQDDVSLALALRATLNTDTERICAPISVSHGGLNGDICRFYLTAEIGSSCDSVNEAKLAAQKLGEALARLIVN